MRVAIVGGGIAGISAAELLQQRHEVTLFESSDRLGGHAHPIAIDNGSEPRFEVDTAFLIFNGGTYPGFLRLLARWGISGLAREPEMSVSFEDEAADLRFAMNRGSWPLLARPGTFCRPRLYRILWGLAGFRRRGREDLASGRARGRTLAEYLSARRYPRSFVESFVYPMALSIWSVSMDRLMEFPAESFLRFFDNHRYFEARSPSRRWMTLRGSSATYLRAFRDSFRGELRLSAPIRAIRRHPGSVSLLPEASAKTSGEWLPFDHVVVATHADQALRLLENPAPEERAALGPWTYQRTPVSLHTDASLMPRDRRLWASWNIRFDSSWLGRLGEPARAAVTYYLNRVQGLSSSRDYFVTLHAAVPGPLLGQLAFEHPIFDQRALHAQARLGELDGSSRTHFCGSYFGFGFHEDAIQSSFRVAERLGCTLP